MDDATKVQRLKKACKMARLDYDDLIGQCREGTAQIFDTPECAAITTINVSGANKFLFVVVMAGTLSGYRALLPIIEAFGRKHECDVVRGVCRPGIMREWAKTDMGYRPIATMFEKVL